MASAGFDLGNLGVFPGCPGTSLTVQIRWPEGVECSPTSTDVLSRLNSWLDSWLDLGTFQGQVTVQVQVQVRWAGGEVYDLRLGKE